MYKTESTTGGVRGIKLAHQPRSPTTCYLFTVFHLQESKGKPELILSPRRISSGLFAWAVEHGQRAVHGVFGFAVLRPMGCTPQWIPRWYVFLPK